MVRLRPDVDREVVVDGREDDRVHEADPVAVAGDDVGAAEGVERGLGGRRVQPGELRGGVRPGALAEDRDRLGERGASDGSRFRRCSTTVEIASGPSARTAAASCSVAFSRLCVTSCRSSETRNGLPPVVSWQARQKPSAACPSTAPRTQSRTASPLSAVGRSTRVAGSVTIARRLSDSCSARGRVPTSSAIGRSSRRRSRKPRKLRLGSSAHWASSTQTTSGCSAARFAHSQYSRAGGRRRTPWPPRRGRRSASRAPAAPRGVPLVARGGALEQLADDAERERALEL